MTTFLNKRKSLTTFDLKVIGLVLMIFDHIHQMFAGAGVPGWFNWLGRPVATIFFFVSVEGFTHTHDKKKYLWRLLIGYWIMGVGDALIQAFFSVGNVALMNNIFGDLFVGVSGMYGYEKFKAALKKHDLKSGLSGSVLIGLPLLLSLYLHFSVQGRGFFQLSSILVNFIYPSAAGAENAYFCYLAFFLYLVKDNRKLQYLFIVIAAIWYTGYLSYWQFNDLFTVNIQWMMIFAIIPIALYNSKRGKSMKYFFYIFYPAHIWGLFILASLLGVK
ncbi:MAG: TraX family protein [Liquorilactobacillus nagelii]|uniref:TraX family protein n=1 Tax=Liquorilactobacillus nagelii TaxID=82688 RepID=UPI0039EAF932